MKKWPLTSEGKSIINDVDGEISVTVTTVTNNIIPTLLGYPKLLLLLLF